jgi:hypothetical protein
MGTSSDGAYKSVALAHAVNYNSKPVKKIKKKISYLDLFLHTKNSKQTFFYRLDAKPKKKFKKVKQSHLPTFGEKYDSLFTALRTMLKPSKSKASYSSY